MIEEMSLFYLSAFGSATKATAKIVKTETRDRMKGQRG